MDISISPHDIAEWIPVFRGLPIWWQIVILVVFSAGAGFWLAWAFSKKSVEKQIKAKDATIETLNTRIAFLEASKSAAAQGPSESWPRLDLVKRHQIANILRTLPRSENRMFDVSIQSLPHSDCRDLAVELRDAIQESGLTAALVDDVMRRDIGPGIWIEGNRTDPMFQKLIEALGQVSLFCQVRHVNGYVLNLRIGRRP